MALLGELFSVLQRHRICNMYIYIFIYICTCIYICIYTYYKELGHTIVEVVKSKICRASIPV